VRGFTAPPGTLMDPCMPGGQRKEGGGMAQIAVIDLGSNSVRMTITRLEANGAHRLVESARAMVRLSEGMGSEGLLRGEPMERTLQALSLFSRLMRVHHVTDVYPVATAAVRQAKNAEAFLDEVHRRTGLRFSVISGDEEAYLDFQGVANTMALADFAMIDIGGASTEIAVIRNREVVGKTSLPWGAVNLTERFGLAGKPSRKKRQAAMGEIAAGLCACSWIPRDPSLVLVGLGGTVRALAKADRKRRNWPIEALHHYEMPADRLTSWMEELQVMDAAARRAVPGIGRERADILAGALLPLQALQAHLGSQRIVVSGSGIREGLFYGHLGRVLNWREAVSPDVRAHAVRNLMLLFDLNDSHAGMSGGWPCPCSTGCFPCMGWDRKPVNCSAMRRFCMTSAWGWATTTITSMDNTWCWPVNSMDSPIVNGC
jgi:exopolyphosphatase / guanosine-5'-triphosphate,3'-diphosphate pyrophosphatase